MIVSVVGLSLFLFRQKTAYELRIGDWSSDVCSSDLPSLARLMAASQRGDRSAYRALLADCRKWLERYFARRIAPHHIDDLVQETLVSMHRKLATWEDRKSTRLNSSH